MVYHRRLKRRRNGSQVGDQKGDPCSVMNLIHETIKEAYLTKESSTQDQQGDVHNNWSSYEYKLRYNITIAYSKSKFHVVINIINGMYKICTHVKI